MGENHVKTEKMIAACKSRKEASEKTNSAYPLTLAFQSPEMQDNRACCKPQWVALCHDSPAKLIQGVVYTLYGSFKFSFCLYLLKTGPAKQNRALDLSFTSM
jgi:hypothetical protein